MISLELSAKRILERALETWRAKMLTATILDSLAHDFFVSLHNERTHWRIVYCNPGVEVGEMKNKTLDKLLEDWSDMLAKWNDDSVVDGDFSIVSEIGERPDGPVETPARIGADGKTFREARASQ
jgi:hypothetical protein